MHVLRYLGHHPAGQTEISYQPELLAQFPPPVPQPFMPCVLGAENECKVQAVANQHRVGFCSFKLSGASRNSPLRGWRNNFRHVVVVKPSGNEGCAESGHILIFVPPWLLHLTCINRGAQGELSASVSMLASQANKRSKNGFPPPRPPLQIPPGKGGVNRSRNHRGYAFTRATELQKNKKQKKGQSKKRA